MFGNFVFCKLGHCHKAVGDSVPRKRIEHIDSALEVESWALVKLVKRAADVNALAQWKNTGACKVERIPW